MKANPVIAITVKLHSQISTKLVFFIKSNSNPSKINSKQNCLKSKNLKNRQISTSKLHNPQLISTLFFTITTRDWPVNTQTKNDNQEQLKSYHKKLLESY